MDVEPGWRVLSVGANFFQLSARLVAGPLGKIGIDVDRLLEKAEPILLTVPAAMCYRVG